MPRMYKRKKKTVQKKQPSEAVKKTGSRGTRGGKPKSTISEVLQKLKNDKVPSKNKRGAGATKAANATKAQQAEINATMKKTSRGLRPTEATRKLRAKIKAEKDAESS